MARRPTPIRDALKDAIVRDRPVVGAVLNIVEKALDRPDVQIKTEHVPAAAATVIQAIEQSDHVAVVPVKSSWLDNINWAQAVGVLATGFAWLGLDVTPEQLLAIITGIQGLVALFTMITKTWFSRAVTTQSAATGNVL